MLLSKVLKSKLPFSLSRLSLYRFGSGGGSPTQVRIDRDATWIKYRTSRRLSCVEGLEQTHYQMGDPDAIDPYTHIKENPIYSLQNIAYNDPYYHEDQHEALVNEEHGYKDGSDPLDTRQDISVPILISFGAIAAMAFLFWNSEVIAPRETVLYREKVLQEHIENTLQAKNQELNDLKEKIRQRLNPQ